MFPISGPAAILTGPPGMTKNSVILANLVMIGYCERTPVITLIGEPERVKTSLGGVIYSHAQFDNGREAVVETELTALDFDNVQALMTSQFPITLALAFPKINLWYVFPNTFVESNRLYDLTFGTSVKNQIVWHAYRYPTQIFNVNNNVPGNPEPCVPFYLPYYTFNSPINNGKLIC